MTEHSSANDEEPHDDEDGGPLPFTTWLHISAKRLQRNDEERAMVLEQAEITKETWQSAERYWNLEIALAIAAGDLSLSQQVADICVRELAGRKLANSGDREVRAPALIPRMATEGGSLKPSFLLRREAESKSAPETPPVTTAPPTPMRAVAPQTPLDFGTAIGSVPGAAPLPFSSSSEPDDSAVARAKQHAAGASAKAPPHGYVPVGGTEAVDLAALARKVLAFGPPTPGAPGTHGSSPAFSKAAAPPPGARSGALPALTVEQYASLCVDVELSPHEVAEALQRYGVTLDGKRALDEAWNRLFNEQPARRGAFEHAKITYRAWLSRGGR